MRGLSSFSRGPASYHRDHIILPSLHNRTHSKVEAWARWSARPKIYFNCDNEFTTKWIRDTSSNVLHAPKPDT